MRVALCVAGDGWEAEWKEVYVGVAGDGERSRKVYM